MDTQKMTQVNIAVAADDNYAPHAGVLIHSVLKTRREHTMINFFVIDGGISEENKTKFRELVESPHCVIFLKPEARYYDAYPKRSHISEVAYYRISIPHLLPQELKKVLYLDCDIIILKDWWKLWDTNLQGYCLAAVENISLNEDDYRHIGFDSPQEYFNSGMLLINMDECRNNKISEKAFLFLEKNAHAMYQDQDALNIAVRDKWLRLPLIFNQQSCLYLVKSTCSSYTREEIGETIGAPVVVHFTDSVKPWSYESEHPLQKHYIAYRKETPWKNFTLLNKTFVIALKKYMRRGYHLLVPINVRKKLKKIRHAITNYRNHSL